MAGGSEGTGEAPDSLADGAAAGTPTPAGRRRRRRGIALVAGVPMALALLWTPAFVALGYRFETSVGEVLARPERGWLFLYDSVRLSRGARLGTEEGAEERALGHWAGRVRALAVRLVWVDGSLTVPVGPGGVPVPRRDRAVRPSRPLLWVVTGSVSRRPRQVIGLLDYANGAAVWDIRQHLPPGRQ